MAYAIINTGKMAATDVGSYNHVGIYTTSDLENGVVVTLGAMNADTTSKLVEGFEYAVTPATASTVSDAYIIASPEIMGGLDNAYVDPRKFINKAGLPLALKKLVIGDVIEVSADAFGSSADYPEASEVGYYVPVAANGKLGTPQSGAISGKISFRVEALSKMVVGDERVDACYLRVMLA